jgi:hypothetical protein
VQDQGVAAAEHESVLGRHLEGDRSHFPLESLNGITRL